MRIVDDSFGESSFISTLGTTTPSLSTPQQLLSAQADSTATTTISHLEHQLAAALVLESPVEYQHCLRAYTRKLASEADAHRLKELAYSLLGPPKGQSDWNPFVLDLSKHDLLRELLPIISQNRALQRLVSTFTRTTAKPVLGPSAVR